MPENTKKVVILSEPNSKYIEQAIIILKDNSASNSKKGSDEIVKEAQKIVDDYSRKYFDCVYSSGVKANGGTGVAITALNEIFSDTPRRRPIRKTAYPKFLKAALCSLCIILIAFLSIYLMNFM